MYLSRLLLNSRSTHVRRDLANVHAMHQRILTAFPDLDLANGARKNFETLFRVDTNSVGEVSILVQSEDVPDWSRLPTNYLKESFEPNPATTTLQHLIERIQSGARLRFRLRANASKRLRPDGAKRGKRVEIIGTDALLGWLSRKSSLSGFELAVRQQGDGLAAATKYAVRVTEEGKVRGFKAGTTLTFGSTLFDGELFVTDASRFSEALKCGLGSAKAFGFGLLSIALT